MLNVADEHQLYMQCTHLQVEEDQGHYNLKGQAPELVEAVGVVSDAVCVSTHEVGNFSHAELGQRCQVHLKGLAIK